MSVDRDADFRQDEGLNSLRFDGVETLGTSADGQKKNTTEPDCND
jgi:hypothetical protein